MQEYLAGYQPLAEQYEGFNLLLFHLHPPSKEAGKNHWGKTEIGYLSNRPSPTLVDIPTPAGPAPAGQGSGVTVGECKGLSNTPMNQPWPKVTRGEETMTRTLQQWSEGNEGETELIERMMQLLQ